MSDRTVPDRRVSARPVSRLRAAFTEHPASVNETYLEHAGVALSFAGSLFVAAMAALVHAVLPCACETTASRIIRRLHTKISARSH